MMLDETSTAPVYRAFGINLQCQLESAPDFGLTEIRSSAAPDAVMRFGAVPETLEGSTYTNAVMSAAPGEILLNLKDTARYLIRNGNEIVIDTYAHAPQGDVATYAFGSAMGALLYQRRVLALHGSAVGIVGAEGGAVIFTGKKGAGKSTTASALALRDKLFLSDDICAVTMDGEKPMLHPGLARSKIALDSYRALLRRTPDAPPVSPMMQKYAAPFRSSRDAQPLRAICVLEEHPGLSVGELRGGEKLAVLMENIYRPLIYELSELPADRFLQCAAVASAIRVYRVRRPKDFADMDALLALLEETVFRS